MNKNVFYGIIAALVLILSGILAGFIYFENKKLSTKPPLSEVISKKSAVETKDNNIQPVANDLTTPQIYSDSAVKWYDAPKLIANPKIFKGDNAPNFKTWEVGEWIDHSNSTPVSKILLVSIEVQGIGLSIEPIRFLASPTGNLELLDKYSAENLQFYGVNSKVVTSTNNNWLKITSLDYPGMIISPEGQKMKKENDYPGQDFENGRTDLDSIFFNNIDQSILVKVFHDKVYGDIFYNNRDKLFYLKAVDGTFKTYSLSMEIMEQGDVPNVTWNDGTKNSSHFSSMGFSGCGVGTEADVIDKDDPKSDIKMSDLIEIGKDAKGNPVYGFKDLNHPYLKKWYQENMDLLKSFNTDSAFGFKRSMSYNDFVKNHLVFFWKDSMSRLIRFVNTDFVVSGGCGKPVIYLYPEKEMNVSVKVNPTGGMTADIPKYNDGWNVISDPNSNIRNVNDGKIYPYLFWEGRASSSYRIPNRGFVAAKDNLENLLDDKLALLGLIPKETNDFKEFWLPKMMAENKPYYFVTFNDRSTIDKLAPLEINPKPDTTIRVLMDYRGLDEYINVENPTLETPERKGFTAVEWGGVLK